MRLLQLNPNGSDASALDFHPMVTVVQGLSAEGRARVVQAVTALPRGTDPGCHGLLEAHGILLDLNADTLAMLDLDGELDVLVTRADLPGHGGAATPSSLGSVLPAAIQPLGVHDFLEVTPRGTYPQLDEARDRHEQSAEALSLLEDAADRARDAYHEAIQTRRDAETALQAAASDPRGNLRLVTDDDHADDAADDADDPEAGSTDLAGDESTTGWLADDAGPLLVDPEPLLGDTTENEPALLVPEGAESSAWSDPDPAGDDHSGLLLADVAEPEPTPAELLARRHELEARRPHLDAVIERVDRGIDELAALDPRPVKVLVEAIRNPPPVEYVPSVRGQELADQFVELQAEVKVLEEGLAARGMDTPSAMARLEAAQAELAAAEKAMRPPEYTDDDRAQLEAAHDEMLEAERKGRSRGGKKRFEEALAAEQAILDRMGFPTWSAYVMGAGLMGIDPAAEQRLERARFELEGAEQHWSDVTAMIEADPVHRELLDKLEALYLEAFDLLGGDDDETEDLENRLRELEEPKEGVSTEELVDALVYQLELLGMKVPPEMAGVDRVMLIAEAFLEEASAIVARLNELGAEKVEALTELEQIDAELATLPSEDELEIAVIEYDDAIAAAEAAALEQAEREAVERDAAEQQAAELAAEEQRQAELAEAERLAAEQAEADRVAAEAAAEQARVEQEAAERADALAVSAAELADLERAYQVAVEEEAEYAELVDAREALLEAAIQVDSVARSRLEALAGELAQHEADLANAAAAAAPTPGRPSGIAPESDAAFDDVEGVDASPEAVEFFLLSRLAALRTVSYAGSVPLLIDDALAGQPRKDVEQLLHKLERMSESVQIIYLSDDDTVTQWAEGVGFERAAVVDAPPAFA